MACGGGIPLRGADAAVCQPDLPIRQSGVCSPRSVRCPTAGICACATNARPVIIYAISLLMPLRPFSPGNGAGKKIFLLKPRGFCAGVVRAIDVVKIALDLYGPPVYVRKEIVHNKHVVDELREAGAIFVEELDEVPVGGRAIFSAHGVAPSVRKQAKERKLHVIDATCPLVTKVHLEAVRFARDGSSIILIGHKDHDEVIGTLGEVPERSYLVETVADVEILALADPTRVRYLTQTTLSLDETREIIVRLKERFPHIQGPPAQDICYATENRQMAVKGVSEHCDLLLVVGSQNSSNSKRLVEVGDNFGVRSYLVNDKGDIDAIWLEGVKNVAVTAGASAPEYLVQELVEFLRNHGFHDMEEIELVEEDVRFSLPSELTVMNTAR
jgi:4-hydroxy-3-methylbut-2-en-1-yl diphosphate reductase